MITRLLRSSRLARLVLTLAGSLLIATACAESPTRPELSADRLALASEVAPAYTPNPDDPMPPPFPFEIWTINCCDHNVISWQGNLLDRFGRPTRKFVVEQVVPAVRQGQGCRLSQVWHDIPGIDGPMQLRVTGTFDVFDNHLSLSGTAADGTPVHIRGQATTVGGATRIVGEIVFQPRG